MRQHRITLLFVGLAGAYWIFESVVHYYIFREGAFTLWPTEPNELWMRSTAFALIIVIGIYIDRRTQAIVAAELNKRAIYEATVSSTQHILNNLMNQMQLCLYEGGDGRGLDEETKKLLRRSLEESREQVARLSAVTELDDEAIRRSVLPQPEEPGDS